MAYTKLKELTKYFDFNKEIDIKELPKYTLDYVEKNETIYKAYKTFRDKAIFTDKRMILFDVNPISLTKKIHIIPYYSISSGALLFKKTSGSILLSLDSGYQMRLDFVRLSPTEKTELRMLYTMMMNASTKK